MSHGQGAPKPRFAPYALAWLACAALAGFACSNSLGKLVTSAANSSTSGTSSTTTTGTDPLVGILPSPYPGSGSAFTIVRVLKNSANPGTTFDILGDGTGAIGQNCVSDGSSGSTGAASAYVGPTTCTCQFTYATTTGATNMIEVPTDYHEPNLLRCKYVGVPSTAKSVGVVIHVKTSDTLTNSITYKFNSSSDNQLATSLTATFLPVQRFQCKPTITIADTLTCPSIAMTNCPAGTRIYDPFQSEDTSLTYPLNFYTTNYGATLSLIASLPIAPNSSESWNCPSRPIIDDYGASIDFGLVPEIWSVAKNTGAQGSHRIFPPQTGVEFDRSTFHLARQPSGVFTVPVNAFVAPNTHSNSPNSDGSLNGHAPLGYGAAPVPTGASGQENCPSSLVDIPPGYEWVKVWLFRMALPPRKVMISQKLSGTAPLACAPGEWKGPNYTGTTNERQANDPSRAYPPDCYKGGDADTPIPGQPANLRPATLLPMNESVYLSDLSATSSKLASRFSMFTGMCFNLDSEQNSNPATNFSHGRVSDHGLTIAHGGQSLWAGPGETTDPTSNQALAYLKPANISANDFFPPGTDVWMPNNKDVVSPTRSACTTSTKADFVHACGPDAGAGVDGSGNPVYPTLNILPAYVPNTSPAPAPDATDPNGPWAQPSANPAPAASAPPNGPYRAGDWEYTRGASGFKGYNAGIPYDDSPTPVIVNSENTAPRYDFLFVVTPTTVMSGDMSSSTAIRDSYTPYRYTNSADCLPSENPDDPTSNCAKNQAKALRSYGLKLHDVSTLGDPPADDPSRTGVFPVCAIRPKTYNGN